MRVPATETVRRVVDALTGAGLVPAVGGSGLLVALGLADVANDWDLTVDADVSAVRAALESAAIPYRDAAERGGVYETGERFVVDGGDHDVDLLVQFALRGPDGPEPIATRVTGSWCGLPIGDPVEWQRAYRLLGRDAKAATLEAFVRRA